MANYLRKMSGADTDNGDCSCGCQPMKRRGRNAAAYQESQQHGPAYRRARQNFLSDLTQNPNVPRFMTGWIRQEKRRQALGSRQRRPGFTIAGRNGTAARRLQLQAIAADPAQSAAAQLWATQQLKRLKEGQRRLARLRKGKTLAKPKLRGIPGYDVGHPIGYVRGTRTPKKSLQDPRTFRPEMATQNRARAGVVRRLRLDPKAYAESNPWEETLTMTREYEYDTELDQFLDSVWGWFAPAKVAIIPRSNWGARAPKCTKALRVPVRYAFIHHTAGSTPTSESQERATMQQVQRYHQDSRGWCDIAYNFLIMPSGRVYEGRGWTRVNGATKGYNSNSIAVCFAGNFETATPTAAAINAGRALLNQGIRDGYLTPDFILRGHRDVGSTACPGRHLYARLNDLDPR